MERKVNEIEYWFYIHVEWKTDKKYFDRFFAIYENKLNITPYIIEQWGARNLANIISDSEKYSNTNTIHIWIFDFDKEWVENFLDIKKESEGKNKAWDEHEMNSKKFKMKKWKNEKNIACLLPIPEGEIKKQVLNDLGNDYWRNSVLYIELLFYSKIDDEFRKKYFEEKPSPWWWKIIEFKWNGKKWNSKKIEFCKEIIKESLINPQIFDNFLPILELVKKVSEPKNN